MNQSLAEVERPSDGREREIQIFKIVAPDGLYDPGAFLKIWGSAPKPLGMIQRYAPYSFFWTEIVFKKAPWFLQTRTNFLPRQVIEETMFLPQTAAETTGPGKAVMDDLMFACTLM